MLLKNNFLFPRFILYLKKNRKDHFKYEKELVSIDQCIEEMDCLSLNKKMFEQYEYYKV